MGLQGEMSMEQAQAEVDRIWAGCLTQLKSIFGEGFTLQGERGGKMIPLYTPSIEGDPPCALVVESDK